MGSMSICFVVYADIAVCFHLFEILQCLGAHAFWCVALQQILSHAGVGGFVVFGKRADIAKVACDFGNVGGEN